MASPATALKGHLRTLAQATLVPPVRGDGDEFAPTKIGSAERAAV